MERMEWYREYVKTKEPKSPLLKDCLFAFLVGGSICTLGEALRHFYLWLGLSPDHTGMAVSMSLIFLSVLLTGFSLYDNLAKHAGAGTLVPITGFANSIAAPAIEFAPEGLLTGTCTRIFSIAGPVLVFGTAASMVYGGIYWLATL